ncbi:MAG: putative capsid protein [Circoviridae sp.]|nr:MAG: putative capsid protein [Circoviridae sp.]
MGYKVAGGHTLLRSFPYAAAAVLASRRYARPAAKWRARRAVATATRVKSARSYTANARRRKSSRKASRRGRARRRGLFNMSPIGCRKLRIKNVNEIQYSWDLNNSTPATLPKRMQEMHTQWMAPPGTNELQEAIFDRYQYKKLFKYSWKLSNFRVFLQTVTKTKASADVQAPAVTDTQITELPDWVFWYWRMCVSGNAFPPAAGDESRYSKFCRKSCFSSIKGFVGIPSHTNAWTLDSYETSFKTSGGSYNNLDTYLAAVIHSGTYGPNTSTGSVPSPDIYIMPDDPYPSTYYPATGDVVRTAKITIVADMTTYSTWKLKMPKTT